MICTVQTTEPIYCGQNNYFALLGHNDQSIWNSVSHLRYWLAIPGVFKGQYSTKEHQNKLLFKNWSAPMVEWLHVNPVLWLEKVRGLTVILYSSYTLSIFLMIVSLSDIQEYVLSTQQLWNCRKHACMHNRLFIIVQL